tara:strand:+ start:512 stop:697 length:186 start_codon:yes stop_codon:yes gene_type:complete
MQNDYKYAFWLGGPTGKPIKIYIHGEYRDKNGFKWLSANKGDDPSIHTFGVKLKDIVWRKK